MSAIDLSTESLLARRALAEKATKGDWYTFGLSHPSDHFNIRTSFSAGNAEQICRCNAPTDANQANAVHIAANSPDVVMATIDEIIRLRGEVEQLEKEIGWFISKRFGCPMDGSLCKLEEGKSDTFLCVEHWREAARKAVEEGGESCLKN